MSDDLYRRAVYHVSIDRKASTSYIPRKLQIGYNAAAALMERMEHEGIVSACNHVGKRDILVGPDPDQLAAKDSLSAPADDDAPPFDLDPVTPADPAVESTTSDPKPEPAPEPVYTGPYKRFTCDGCDTEAHGPENDRPRGWWTQTSAKLGTLYKCESCASKNASRIATEHMTTEQIMSAGDDADRVTIAAQNRVKSFVKRILTLREDARAVTADLKEVSQEAKGEGFDWTTMMRVAREAEKDPQKRQEADALFDTYAQAFGLEN